MNKQVSKLSKHAIRGYSFWYLDHNVVRRKAFLGLVHPPLDNVRRPSSKHVLHVTHVTKRERERERRGGGGRKGPNKVKQGPLNNGRTNKNTGHTLSKVVMAKVAMLRLLSEMRFSRSMLQLVTALGWIIAIYSCRKKRGSKEKEKWSRGKEKNRQER